MTDILRMLKRVANKIKRTLYKPRISIQPDEKAEVRVGTTYGGKTFMDRTYLQGSTIFSVGLGEDASFDVEFAAKYGARVIIFDPTPRSIDYFARMRARMGQAAACGYGTAGCLPIESYDMSKLTGESLTLIERALWIEPTTLRFFLPQNVDHVSHSIVNFQNDFRTDTPFIEVESITLGQAMADFGLDRLSLLKLDIEGAELKVLGHMLDEQIFPRQILVEFDELARPSAAVRAKYEALYARLTESGYVCRAWDGYSDYCFEHAVS